MLNRRDFLKSGAVAAVVGGIALKMPGVLAGDGDEGAKSESEVVVVRKGSPVAMFRKGIAHLGGMAAFVKPGQKVLVKPNIGWDNPPEMAANTNPELVGEIVRQCLEAGAKQVDVFDHTCNEEKACYRSSGIYDAVVANGGSMHSGADVNDYIERECAEAGSLKKAQLHRLLLEADVVINVPILKNHGGAKMTACMKNYMGVVWDRQTMHRNNLPQSIADSVMYRKPDLNILDAYRIMVSNGPRGLGAGDVRDLGYLLLSTDIVAIDLYGTKLLKYSEDSVPYIKIAADAGLGNNDEKHIKVTRMDA